MSDRHIHRYEEREFVIHRWGGLRNRTVRRIMCPCGLTMEEAIDELAAALKRVERRVHELHCGDETCDEDHGMTP